MRLNNFLTKTILLSSILILTDCSTPKVTETPMEQTPYPAPQTPISYPLPESSQSGGELSQPTPQVNPAYPLPGQSTLNPGTPVKIVPFKLNKPIVEGVTEVHGTGPADIPVTLFDITFGVVLSETTVNPDGTFVFKLLVPLEKGRRLGITYSDLKGTRWVPANFNDKGFNGDSPRLVPQFGFFFDTANVESK